MEIFCYTLVSIAALAVIIWAIYSIVTMAANQSRGYGTDTWDGPMYTSWSYEETIYSDPPQSEKGKNPNASSNEGTSDDPDRRPDTGDTGNHQCER